MALNKMAETDPELNESKSSIEQAERKDEVRSSSLDWVLTYCTTYPSHLEHDSSYAWVW